MRGKSYEAAMDAALSGAAQLQQSNVANIEIQFPEGVNTHRKTRQAMGIVPNYIRTMVGDKNVHCYGFIETEGNTVSAELRRYDSPDQVTYFTNTEEEN